MTTETPTKAAEVPEGSKSVIPSVTFMSPRIKNTRVVLRPQSITRNNTGLVIDNEPGISVQFTNHELRINEEWADKNRERLAYYDVDAEWVVEKLKSHELFHKRDGWFVQGLPPGALLPLVADLRPKIIEAAAKGDVETLVEIRSTELETHARDEILDEVAAALTALADEGEDEKG